MLVLYIRVKDLFVTLDQRRSETQIVSGFDSQANAFTLQETGLHHKIINHKNYNFLACDWFKKVLFSTNSLAKLLSDSLLLDSSISQLHSKM